MRRPFFMLAGVANKIIKWLPEIAEDDCEERKG